MFKVSFQSFFLFSLSVGVASAAFSQPPREDLNSDFVFGRKFPNSPSEGVGPVISKVKPLRFPDASEGFNDLLPFLMRAPDQEDAGTCLYMSLTGVAEWWLAKLNPQLSRDSDGPLDLSERFFVNSAGLTRNNVGVKNWLTDTIYVFNNTQTGILNRDYRFAKGWFRKTSHGFLLAGPTEQGAAYGTSFNWINQLASIAAEPVRLPTFERTIFLEEPNRNQWNVGLAPHNIVETVKMALTTNRAPVQVIYNHMGYWHSVFVVGFDDSQDNGNCPFVESFLKHMKSQVETLTEEVSRTESLAERQKLLFRINKAQDLFDKASHSYTAVGGCNPKGVFYVRDSIYSDPNAPLYDYDPTRQGEEAPYTMNVVLHEYTWLQTLSNHVVQIVAK
jgi:hypothetical protein